MTRLSEHDQKTLLYSLIRSLSKQHLPTESPSSDLRIEGQSKAIGGAAALIAAIVGDAPILRDHLIEWLVGVSADAIGQVHVLHRAVTAAISIHPGK